MPEYLGFKLLHPLASDGAVDRRAVIPSSWIAEAKEPRRIFIQFKRRDGREVRGWHVVFHREGNRYAVPPQAWRAVRGSLPT